MVAERNIRRCYIIKMLHRHRTILLVVKIVGYETDRAARYNFFNKDCATFPCSIIVVADIKSQINFFKVDMKRNFNSEESGVREHETYKAHVHVTVINIKDRFIWQVGR